MGETRVFYDQVHPVCDMEDALITLRGLSITSGAWNYETMKTREGTLDNTTPDLWRTIVGRDI